jgi:hypothetical protein
LFDDNRTLRTVTCPECRAPIDPEYVKVVNAPPPDAKADAAEKLIADRATAAEVEAAASKKRRRDEEVGAGAGAGAEDAPVRAERLAQRRRLEDYFSDERTRLYDRLNAMWTNYSNQLSGEFSQMPDTRPPYTVQWRNDVYYTRRFLKDLYFDDLDDTMDPGWAIYDLHIDAYQIYKLNPGENEEATNIRWNPWYYDPEDYEQDVRGREWLNTRSSNHFNSRHQWELVNAYIDRLQL